MPFARRPAVAFTIALMIGCAHFCSWAISAAFSEIRLTAAELPFRFETGSRGRHDLLEIMGGGLALIDADGDGRLDLYFCQGGPIVADPGRADQPGRLFRNRGGRRFEEVAGAGVAGPRYAMGAAVGDVDGDGRDDLFVSGFREQRLYRNLGDCRFEDVTASCGVNAELWGTSAAFLDVDLDGDLDLFLCGYIEFDPATAPYTAAPDGRRDYPGPEEFRASRDRLFLNDGRGRFSDVSAAAGIDAPAGRGLGVVAADFDGDGRVDLFVADDGTPARLYLNQGGARFVDAARDRGLAVDGRGDALAGMGVARGDVDGDGRPDLAVTNFLGRSTILFVDQGNALYRDESEFRGLATATRPRLGFGVALVDLDGDRALDLLQANGHVLDRARLGEPFAMPTTLLRNQRGRFVDAAQAASPRLARPILGRGLATGDLDDDGRIDLVVAALDSAPVIYWNDSKRTPAVVLDLEAGGGTAVGTRVEATIGGRTDLREVVGGGSYLSASDRRVFLDLGDADAVERVVIRRPSGDVETLGPLRPGPTVRRPPPRKR